MAANNITFPIYNADGTSFNNLVLKKAVYDSVVMSLGDKITGDVYYKDNTLVFTMGEYVEYNGVKYTLVNPPTVVREGMVSDNSTNKGMTKYSLVFYHPMYMLGNFPFTDVAVSSDQNKYLSQNKKFSWMGTGFDLIDKLNKNLEGTQWFVVASDDVESRAKLALFPSQIQANGKEQTEKQDVLTFDEQYISDVLKVFYDNWKTPFVIDKIEEGEYYFTNGQGQRIDWYSQAGGNKRFVIVFGLPSNQILDGSGNEFVFQFGKNVGLKNNSRTQKNNKIITRLAGYGSENNIPYGYPQIIWYGNQSWDYTIDNDPNNPNSYPIYKGIVNGQYVKLIKHPFTRKNLMPTVYINSVFNKVSRYLSNGNVNPDYNPNTTIVDYYDAIDDATHTYPNNIVQNAPSFEIHQFENIKPELTSEQIVAISAYDDNEKNSITVQQFTAFMNAEIAAYDDITARYLTEMLNAFNVTPHTNTQRGFTGGSYTYEWSLTFDGNYCKAFYNSPVTMFQKTVKVANAAVDWDDSMDNDGNYKQSYFKITLPQLGFDLYACAAITEEMEINMRSGACMGCTFAVQVDWDDYKKNFYDSNGNFAPNGSQRDLAKYPKSNLGQITVVVAKDIDTFGTILPDSYRQPSSGDEFVILGISLPQSYVTAAQVRLDEAMKEYMLENNVYYYDYPLKFDEYFLATHESILAQMRNNSVVAFVYGNEPTKKLYIKQITVKYGDKPLPTYDITITDDVEIVLNQIGQVTDDVSRVRLQMSELQKYYGINLSNLIEEKLSRVSDDVAKGRITFQQGLDAIGRVIFSDEIKSNGFVQGMTDQGRGWRIDAQGNAEFESLRCRSYLEVIELLINRLQAQEGDTLFTDNDQITFVEEKTYNETTYYKLTLKEKWDGYTTCQKVGNIVKGIINTLAANAGNVSDVTPQQSVESDGDNKYYTSWMRVIDPSNYGDTNGTNQICVVLFGDDRVPAGKNFAPCELMNIARWGCLNAEEIYGQNPTQTQIEDVKRRQRLFILSTTDGRITKLRGVNSPILIPENYGTTLGLVPDFINQWSIASRLKPNMDYLYAQGIIVGDFIKVDAAGEPITNYVDKGEWQDNTEYLCNEYNSTTQQYETHDVWHNNALWRCLQHQPVTSGGTTRYYEPTDANSAYWQKLMYSQQGQPGQNGYNSATLTIYKRSAGEPASNDKPSDLTYSFSTGSASGNMNGWSWEIPTANGLPCWTRQVFISSRNSTEEIPRGNWGNPQALVEDGISYEIQVPVESIRFASGQTAYTLSGDANFFKKSGSASKVQTQFYYAVYKRTGNSYVKVASGQANKYTFSNLSVPSTIDAITVYIFDASYSGTTPETNGYLAKAEIKVNKDGEQGGSGGNSGTPTLYKRSATEITQTGFSSGFTLYYKFEDGKLYTDEACTTLFVSQNGWTQEIPSGSNPLYVTMAVAFNSGVCDAIGYNEWVTPSKFVENGAQGGHGTNTAPVMIYKRAATAPTDKPVTLYYEFATGLLKKLSGGSFVTPDATTDLLGWSQNIPAHNGNPCWVKQCAAVNTDSYDEINTNEWSSPAVKLVEDGDDGDTVRSITVYKVAATQPDPPVATSVSDSDTTVANGWLIAPPSIVVSTKINNTGLNTDIGDITPWADMESSDAGYSLFGAGWKVAKGNKSEGSNSKYVVDRVYFTPLSNDETLYIQIAASAEMLYDGVFVGYLNTAATLDDSRWSNTSYSTKGSSVNTIKMVSVQISNLSGTMCFVDIVFRKDSSSYENQDCGYYRIVNRIWSSNATLKNGDVQGSWSSPAKWNGVDGTNGSDGARGKTGRFYYYAQAFNVNDTTTTYVVTDAQAPYFSYNNQYWVFNPSVNYPNGITMHDMGTPSSQNSNWQIMTNDFKYLITQAIFGDYAQFGSAIINGDFLMSTNGEISGEKYNKDDLFDGSPAYTMFNPLFPYAGSKASTIARKIVSTNTSYNVSWERLTDDFTLNQYNTYRIAVTARVSNSSCLGAIRIIFDDGGTDGVNDLYIMTVTGTSNATYYAIVTVPARYSDCHLVCGVSSASYTMYIEDISIECTAQLRDITQTIASTTAVNIADTLRLSRSKQCRIKVHVSSKTGGSIYVRLFYNNTSSVASSSLDQYSSSGTITLTYTRSSSSPYATFDLQAYMSSASYNATIDWITIEQYVNGSYRESPVLFTPNYVLDLLSGETYQSDGVFTGFVKKKEIVVNISNKSYYASHIYAGSYVIDYVDMLKTGTYVNVNFTQISRVALPIKRDLVGTTVIVKNTGTQDCYVAYVFKHTFYNTLGIVGANQIRYYELVSEKDGDGNEHIYWSASDAMTINTDYD